MREFRLAASGIIIQNEKVLLNTCKNPDGDSFLVGPGGGVMLEEDLVVGLKREIKEETGLTVNPSKILFIEDLLSSKYRMIKIWFLCSVTGGTLSETEEAKIEGIEHIGWYSKEQVLNKQTVYPEILKTIDWNDLLKDTFQTQYFPLKEARF